MPGISKFEIDRAPTTAARDSGFASRRTARLMLSAPGHTDLDDFHRLHHDARVYRDAPLARHPDLAYSTSAIADIQDDWTRDGLGYWSVRELDTAAFLGVGGVRRAGYPDRAGNYRTDGLWNVYYRFHPVAWGLGFASETITAAARCCAELEPQARLVARIGPLNVASRRVVERLGMTLSHEELDAAGQPQVVYEGTAVSLGR